MAKNKGAIVRYRTIDRCLRDIKRKYGIQDLIRECSEALTNALSEETKVSRRQIYEDLNYMESDMGYQAIIDHHYEGRNVYYRYADPDFSIEKMPLTDAEIDQLKETILMLNRFKGMPHFEWMEEIVSKIEDAFMLKGNAESVISFEQNPDLVGLKNITPLFDAIVHKRVLKITYKSFKRDTPDKYEMHPYFLKQYNNRWFLFGLTTERNQITNLPLDRIENITILDAAYIDKDEDLDIEDYFYDIIGVTIENKPKSEVILEFTKERYPYVKNKPIHHSQRNNDDEKRIIIKVIPNNELYQTLLSFGGDVKVIEPIEVREKMAEHAVNMYNLYKKMQ